jgi:hypothetical protein
MRRAHVSPARVARWLDDTARYAAKRHGIYLIYSHSYDFLRGGYAAAMSGFLDRIETLRRAGRLRTTDMVTAAAFMDRFVRTTSSFTRSAGGVHVRLHNASGLRSIAFAVPTAWLGASVLPAPLRETCVEGGYTILSVESDHPDLDLMLPDARESPAGAS